MAESPDGKGVLLFGGERGKFLTICGGSGDSNPDPHPLLNDRILEFRAGTMMPSWNILNITLENGRCFGLNTIPLQ